MVTNDTISHFLLPSLSGRSVVFKEHHERITVLAYPKGSALQPSEAEQPQQTNQALV